MESRKINPWQWQDQFGFSQAIETTTGCERDTDSERLEQLRALGYID